MHDLRSGGYGQGKSSFASATIGQPDAFIHADGHSCERIQMQRGVPMRDFLADWKKWSRAERVLAGMVILLMVALPLGLLMTG